MTVNNAFYDDLGERWYTACDDPVALLRAESRLRTPWLLDTLRSQFGPRRLRVLDVACGAGFLSNPLAAAGHETLGLDLARSALDVARRHDGTGSVGYLCGDARHLPFPDRTFEVVCAMDFLEHIRERECFLQEVARVLRPGGLFFFHTFNRNLISYLVAIQGVAWLVRNTPKDMHVLDLFLKPAELGQLCAARGLDVEQLRGVRPRWRLSALAKLLFTGRVDPRFEFVFTPSLLLGYSGYARRPLERNPPCSPT